MIGRCEGAMDLARKNPALAFALASNWIFHRPPVCNPMRATRALLRKKRRVIAGWLGFPAADSVVRALGRIPVQCLSVRRLLYLRQACANPQITDLLGFIGRLNGGVIRLVTDPALLRHCSVPFLNDVGQRREEDDTPLSFFQLRDVLGMQPNRTNWVCRSYDQLERVHEECIERLNRTDYRDIPFIVFPPPPVPPLSPFIEPLADSQQLIDWGRHSRNCCASYWRQIAHEKNVYLYKVETPENISATVAVFQQQGEWRLGEVKESCNRPAGEEVQKLLEQWLGARSKPCA
jgi:hypothetical protein